MKRTSGTFPSEVDCADPLWDIEEDWPIRNCGISRKLDPELEGLAMHDTFVHKNPIHCATADMTTLSLKGKSISIRNG